MAKLRSSVRSIPYKATKFETLTIAEVSIAQLGDELIYTGNTFACYSSNGGQTWRHLDPADLFEEENVEYCDQTVLCDKSGKIAIWLVQYDVLDEDQQLARSGLRLCVSSGDLGQISNWTQFDLNPIHFNKNWEGEWFDFNHAALSNGFLFVATNVFKFNHALGIDEFKRSFILRVPLKSLGNGSMAGNSFYEDAGCSFRLVQGAKDRMYFASFLEDANNRRLGIFEWPDNSDQIVAWEVVVPPWIPSESLFSACPDGKNWLKRADSRLMAGWVTDGVIGVAWTADKINGKFPQPYVNVVRIDIQSKTLLDSPIIWSKADAFAYPDVAVNAAGKVGISLFKGGKQSYPSHVVGFWDEVAKGWVLKTARSGTHSPVGAVWGDYLTVRPDPKTPTGWLAAGFTLQKGRRRTDIVPHFVRFAPL
jgi:hypothetical protein